MFSDLNTEYLTKLEKETKYLLKITNLKVNPGSYRIKFNLPQITSKPAVSEPLFIKNIDGTVNYQFKLSEIRGADISHIKLVWPDPPNWGEEHLLFIGTPSNPQMIWTKNVSENEKEEVGKEGGFWSPFQSFESNEYQGAYPISFIKENDKFYVKHNKHTVEITHFIKTDGSEVKLDT